MKPDAVKTVRILPDHWRPLPRESFRGPGPAGIWRIPLTIEEPSGVDRAKHPVTNGLPIAEGAPADPAACRFVL